VPTPCLKERRKRWFLNNKTSYTLKGGDKNEENKLQFCQPKKNRFEKLTNEYKLNNYITNYDVI